MLKKSAQFITAILMVISLSLTITPIYNTSAQNNNEGMEQYEETNYQLFRPSYTGDAAWLNDFDLEEDPATAGKVILVKYVGTAENLTIPAKVTIGTTEYDVTLCDRPEYFLNTSNTDDNNTTKSVTFATGFDTSNVTNMTYMFYNCKALTSINISSFNTENVTDMNHMFSECSSLSNLDLSNFDLTSLSDDLNHDSTLQDCTSLQTINIPINLHKDIPLPGTFCREDNPDIIYTSLPTAQTSSFIIVKVNIPTTGVTVTPTNQTINVGNTFTITPTVTPDNATDKSIIWTSSDDTIATVDDNGKVTALMEGTATITATTNDGGFTASCVITVVKREGRVTGITVTPISKTASVGEIFFVTPYITPVDAEDKSVTWSSSNPSIATVDSNGKVTAIREGVVTITATTNDGGLKATCTVTVIDSTADVHRFYNPISGEHLFTSNDGERSYLTAIGWNYEGVAWTAPYSSNRPVYRVFNPYTGEHHYTMNDDEINYLLLTGWNNEGISWYSVNTNTRGTPVYRLFNPYIKGIGAHHYTVNTSERDYLISLGWNYEGIGWYGL